LNFFSLDVTVDALQANNIDLIRRFWRGWWVSLAQNFT